MINMFIGIITARMLGPDGTGHFQVFASTQSIVATVFSLGLGQASIYYINNKGCAIKNVVNTLIKFYIPLTGIITISIAFLVYFFSDYFGRLSSTCLILYSVGTSALLFTTSLKAILLADLNVVKIQVVQYVSHIFILAVVLYLFIEHLNLSVNTLLIIYSIGTIVSALWLLCYFRNDIDWRIKFDKYLFKPLCKLGVMMSTSNIASIVYLSSPVYALTWFYVQGFNDAGLYSRSLSIMTIATFTVQSIGPLLYSKMSSSTLEAKLYQARISAHSFFIFNVVLMVGILLLAPYLIYILYGSQFAGSTEYLRLLAYTLPFNGVISVGTNLLSSEGMASKVVISLTIGVLVFWITQLIVAMFNIPILVCVSVILANIATGGCMITYSKKYFSMSLLDYFPIRFSEYFNVVKLLYQGIK